MPFISTTCHKCGKATKEHEEYYVGEDNEAGYWICGDCYWEDKFTCSKCNNIYPKKSEHFLVEENERRWNTPSFCVLCYLKITT